MSGSAARQPLDCLVRPAESSSRPRSAVDGLARPAESSSRPRSAVDLLAKVRKDAVLWRQWLQEAGQRQQEAEQQLETARRDFAEWLRETRHRQQTERERNQE